MVAFPWNQTGFSLNQISIENSRLVLSKRSSVPRYSSAPWSQTSTEVVYSSGDVIICHVCHLCIDKRGDDILREDFEAFTKCLHPCYTFIVGANMVEER